MKKAFVVLGILATLFASSLKAETTKALVQDCKTTATMDPIIMSSGDTTNFTPTDWINNGYCLGYIAGIAHGISDTEYEESGSVYTINITEGTTSRQLVGAFLKYAAAHPEDLDKSPTYVVLASFVDAGLLKAALVGTLIPNKKPTSVPAPLPDNRSKT